MTTGKTITLTRWTFVGKVMSLLFNMLYRLVVAFLPREPHDQYEKSTGWAQRPREYVLYLEYLDFIVNIVKAMAFPVVMYECESWTIKKAEH